MVIKECLQVPAEQSGEARALVTRLGKEYLAWYEYMLTRKGTL